MVNDVGDSYDEMVELYAAVNLDAMERDENARGWLDEFATRAKAQVGPVADLGCGPGHIVDYLSGLGLSVLGFDISPGQIAMAAELFPDADCRLGDLADLDVEDGTFAGIVSRYSVIHHDPAVLPAAFAEWRRVLAPNGVALVSFFGSLTAQAHGTPFDHKVVTAHELFPATVALQMEAAGFEDIEVATLPAPPESPRPFDQATILARRPGI